MSSSSTATSSPRKCWVEGKVVGSRPIKHVHNLPIKNKKIFGACRWSSFKNGEGGVSLLFLWAECSSLSSNVKEFDFLFLSFLSPVDNLFNLNLIFGWFGFMLGNFVSTLFCAL